MRIIQKIFKIALLYFRSPYFGFIQGHDDLRESELLEIKNNIGKTNSNTIHTYETEMGSLIGDGYVISFAAARMGFYSILKSLNIGSGDEIILLGSNCSVMVNAVIRIGAKPMFSDIDPNTFGSSLNEIQKVISPYTKVIVAQHSFGIPCDIDPIVNYAKSNGIFLIEDCALTLGSKVNGITVGNFGDAAIFSTDHSKPLNTMIGGFVYTKNRDLYTKLKEIQFSARDLPIRKQKAIFKRIKLERKFCNSKSYGKFLAIESWESIRNRIFKSESAFLMEDYSSQRGSFDYYPAKFPLMLAILGLIEIDRWKENLKLRNIIFEEILKIVQNSPMEKVLPSAYFNKNLTIYPLRFVWSEKNRFLFSDLLSKFIHTDWFWFQKPIIASQEPLENFGYIHGSCSISESIGKDIINIPCNIRKDEIGTMLKLFKKTIKEVYCL
ncbi:DegT/DnrJ/EryC1/StrS family aminotransferase [Leptospira vanthielii]|uniref:DegT/DnrJ/EryC1/StrS aminotransferase domain protein n=1 Tax=Leptospira vanthielii serovar Holland str. Waz Holland = ATCC 700522 TaxID=1218591 RepID=N1WCQ6_9LEPT|nr:DegT/DnrJ/EryC1/StrS family aminotransferase [Leptospira vanthielii]EMY69631.1 DegT/DnrJ/EryC1/StrS aminotransferase domain protein [Leptospira vanthielii serovar Holland str. Waz Holland = ATCC 700522]